MTVDAARAPSTKESNAALIAELTPEMLAKLKDDSRQQAMRRAFFWTIFGVFVVPNLFRHSVPETVVIPSAHLADWLGLLVALSMLACLILGCVTLVRAFIGQPALLRTELTYRRQHGKWRWER
jgi:hypothetical protein